MVKFILILTLGFGVWSIGSFLFGGTKYSPEKVEGKTETELIQFARSVYDNVKSGRGRDFAAQVMDLKQSGLKESYEYLKYISIADDPEWIVEKRSGIDGYFVTFKTPGGIRSYILVEEKNNQWKFACAGQ